MNEFNTISGAPEYYTLDQARQIIYEEMAKDRERLQARSLRRRQAKVLEIKTTLVVLLLCGAGPLLMFWNWLGC